MSAASKHRQPRLRASCDGCFLAKVKCSKARPICSRCLACGIECRYSPSSRAGKPKSDNSNNQNHNNNNNHHHHHHHSTPIQQDMAAVAASFSPSMADDKTGLMYAAAAAPGLYRLDTGWQIPSNMDVPPGSSISRNHSISSELALLAMEENTAAAMAAAAANGDMYTTGAVPWTTPPTDLHIAQFADSSMSGIPMHATAHGNFSMTAGAAASGMPWMDTSVMDLFPYGQVQPMHGHSHSQPQPPPPPLPHQHQQQQQQMPTPGSIASSSANNYFPSPSTTPSLRQSPATGHTSVPLSSSSSGVGGGYAYHSNSPASCSCFTSCLHALQALHNASTPAAPPFDVVLTLNRNAVEGCAAMLACPRCMRRSGTHTAAMLLATLLGKITSFYKTASQLYFRPAATVGEGNHGDAVDSRPEEQLEAAPSTSVPPPESTSPTNNTTPFTAAGLGLGVSLGAYQLQGEDGRWLELEILNRELKKLEEVYARFREVCGDVLFEDVAVSKAMIGYLGQTLGAALDLVNHSKEDLQFV